MHQNDVAANLNSDLLNYLKDQNVFMERLLTMLNHGLVSKDLREFARFKNILQELISKHEFLRKTLRTWRARMQGEPTAPQPEPEPQRSEAGPAAPPPQVKHVAWSSSAPAALPNHHWLGLLGAGPGAGSGMGRRDERPPEDCGGRAAEGTPGPHEGGLCVQRPPPSSYMEPLLRRGIAIEAAMVRLERTGHRLDDLLKQAPTSHRLHIDWRSVTESDTLWAVATIRRDDGQKADAAYILQCVIQNEIEPIAGILEELRTCNSCLCKYCHNPDLPKPDPTRARRLNFEETIKRTVELHEVIRFHLSYSPVRMLGKSRAQPEPEPLQPKAPKAGGVPVRPT